MKVYTSQESKFQLIKNKLIRQPMSLDTYSSDCPQTLKHLMQAARGHLTSLQPIVTMQNLHSSSQRLFLILIFAH